MPRKTGIVVSQFPVEITYRGLTPIVDGLDTVSGNVTDLEHTQEAGNQELKRIRRTGEILIDEEVGVPDD